MDEKIDKMLDKVLTVQYNLVTTNDLKASLAYEIQQMLAEAETKTRKETIWNIMSPKTEGLFDSGELFIKRAPIEQAIINMIGYEEYKAMQEAVDTKLNSPQGKEAE